MITTTRHPSTAAARLHARAHTEGFEPLEPRCLLNVGTGAELGWDNRVFYPEGFAGATISEFVPITNFNSQASDWRLVARFETGERDQIIAQGTIPANTRGGVQISRFDQPQFNLVEQGRPYALELQSSLPLSAMLSHYDFGAATGEAFTDRPAQTWYFAEAFRGQGFSNFLVWQNPTETNANVTVTFHAEDSPAVYTYNVTTEAFRRGGLSIAELPGMLDGRYGVTVTSDQPLVTALTRYDTRGDFGRGSTALGTADAPSTQGFLPLAGIGTGQDQSITFFNPNPVDTAVTLTFININEPGTTLTRSFNVAADSPSTFDFSPIRDTLGNEPFAVQFQSSEPIVGRGTHSTLNDNVANSFGVAGATDWRFAEGFVDPGRAGDNIFSAISVVNLSQTDANVVTFSFTFDDGFVLNETRVLQPNEHAVIQLHEFEPLLAQGRDFGRYYFGTRVTSDSDIIAQKWHFDLTLGTGQEFAGGFSTLGQTAGDINRFDPPLA